MSSFRLLNSVELNKLSKPERLNYYSELYKRIKETDKFYESNKRYLKQKINDLIRDILINQQLPYDLIVDGTENLFGTEGPVIFASSHQDYFDAMNTIYSAPTPVNILSNKNIKVTQKALLSINGAFFVNRANRRSRNRVKIRAARYLDKGYSINIYPSGTFNLSRNKLHLPYHIGIINIAKRTGRPIIPVVQEYKYGYNENNEFVVTKVYVRFGTPIYVKKNDDVNEKLAEYDEQMSTMAWDLMRIDADKYVGDNPDEMLYGFNRDEIEEQYYQDFLKMKIKTITDSGSTLEEEEKSIYNYDDEFYDMHPINSDLTGKGIGRR